MSQVLNSIGSNPHKEETRSLVAAQLFAFADALHNGLGNPYTESLNLCCLTLPGERFPFERLISGLARGSNRDSWASHFNFSCAEISKQRFEEALNHKPDNCSIALVDFNLLMTEYDVVCNKYGIGKGLSHLGEYYYDMVWADYCGSMNQENLQAIKKMIQKHGNRNFLFYVTFSISRLFKNGGKSQYDAMEQTVTKILKDGCKSHHSQCSCILKVKYAGGDGYHYPMFTMGFSIGQWKCPVVDVDFRHTCVKNNGTPQYTAYRIGLKKLRKESQDGLVDFSLSKENMGIGSKHMPQVVSLADYDKKAMKDEIERVALSIRNQYDSVKDLNVAVHKIIRKKYPKANLQHVSATITVRVTHRDLFAKAAKKRTVA